MVFTFEHVGLDRMPEGSKWDLKPLELPLLKKNLTIGSRGWPASAGTRSTSTTMISREQSRGSATT
jgi:hypothetical protein